MFRLIFYCFFSILMFHTCLAINAKGCVPLDSWTFDKVVSRFKASIIKFDTAYPYGGKHDEYVKLSAGGYTSPDLLIAEVGVKDYGDMENMDLVERFGVKKDDFPVVKLFVQGNTKPVDFIHEDFTVDELKKFIRRNADVYIGLEHCLENMDRLADKFVRTEDMKERKKFLREAEDEWDRLTDSSERQSAETYVKFMRRMLEKGNDFVVQEKTRVEGLVKGKITKEKKDQMQSKLNILQSFVRDEL